MIRMELVPGKKGPDDVLVRLWADGDVLSFSELLFILDTYFRAEATYYPKEKGFMGSGMLLRAIQDVFNGVGVLEVCQQYKLDYKVNAAINPT